MPEQSPRRRRKKRGNGWSRKPKKVSRQGQLMPPLLPPHKVSCSKSSLSLLVSLHCFHTFSKHKLQIDFQSASSHLATSFPFSVLKRFAFKSINCGFLKLQSRVQKTNRPVQLCFCTRHFIFPELLHVQQLSSPFEKKDVDVIYHTGER